MSDSPQRLFLRLNGIPLEGNLPPDELVYTFDPQGIWRPLQGDHLYDIEWECVALHDALADKIFGGIDRYYSLLPSIPQFVQEAGLNSESIVSRNDFEQLLAQMGTMPHLNQLLYLYDCRKLVSAIQECTKEVSYLVGEFYRMLNLDELFYPPGVEPDGVRWITSPVVTNLTAILSVVFIRLHSLLDYTTKLVFELDHLRSDFATYPRLASSNILFGDRRRTWLNEQPGTLFEPGEPITEIEHIRNLVIHDGLLDDMPKVYKVIKDGRAVEKYILMPDRTDGHLDKFKNRNLFYSREDKINLRLPSLIRAFQSKQLATLRLALARFTSPTT